MEYRVLGKTGFRVSVFTIGTWQLSGPVSIDGRADGFPDVGKEAVLRLIRQCGDLGINSIDSAEIYGGGEGERRVGEAIEGQRDRWIVTTKFGMRVGPQGERIVDTSPAAIRPSLERSLKRLRTSYVDVFLYHANPHVDTILEGRQELERLKDEGKLRAYGISTDHPETLSELAKRGAVEVVMFSRSLLSHPRRVLEIATTHDLGILVRGALASGRLSGKYFAAAPRFSEEDIRGTMGAERWRYPIFEAFRPANLSMTAFALRYLLDFDSTHSVVLGGKTIEDYETAITALDAPPLSRKQHLELAGLRTALALERKSRRLVGRAAQRLERTLR